MLLLRKGICQFLLKKNLPSPFFLVQSRTNSIKGSTTPNTDNEQGIVHSSYEKIDFPKILLHDLLWKNFDKWHNKIAIECQIYGKRYTYGQLRKACKKFGAALLKCGLKSGTDVVSVILPNMPEYPAAILGAIEAGLTVSTLNPLYTPSEIAHQMADCNSSCIVTHYNYLNSVLEALVLGKSNRKVTVICVDDFDGRQRTLPSDIIRFSEMLNTSEELLNVPEFLADRIILQPYSSGTTGLPKGVCLSHYNITSNLLQTTHNQMNGICESTENHQDAIPAVIPFFHMYGFVLIMCRGLYQGAKIVTLPKFDPKSFLDILRSNKEIFLHAVPPMILFLGSHESVRAKDLDQLKFTMTGAAPCSVNDIEKLLSKKKHKVFQGYGLTEASPVLTYPSVNDDDISSVGPSVVGTLGKTINWTTGETLPTGNVGELCFKGPQMMVRYHNNSEATEETIDKEGWLHTGDVGYFDNTGKCYILDRIKELIKVKGFQVAPAELEAVLRQHPSISDAGVTSFPCSRNGEVPVAFAVLKPDVQPPNELHVKTFVASKVAPYKQLAHVQFVDSIPTSASGKILRRKLKELAKTKLNADFS